MRKKKKFEMLKKELNYIVVGLEKILKIAANRDKIICESFPITGYNLIYSLYNNEISIVKEFDRKLMTIISFKLDPRMDLENFLILSPDLLNMLIVFIDKIEEKLNDAHIKNIEAMFRDLGYNASYSELKTLYPEKLEELEKLFYTEVGYWIEEVKRGLQEYKKILNELIG